MIRACPPVVRSPPWRSTRPLARLPGAAAARSIRATSRTRSTFYARARAEAPVFFSDELGYWVVSRYDDIQAIFKDPATFSSENTQAPYKPRPPEVQRILDEAGVHTHSSGLSARQPPDHTRLRGFIQKAFTPRRVAALEPEVRELTVGMIERMAAAGQRRPRGRPREPPAGAA